MSQDQKPRPVKAVTIAGGAVEAAQAERPESTDVVDVDAAHKTSATSAKSAFPLIATTLFLLGCAIGGAGLTALPHLMPEMAEQLYGAHP